MAYTLSNMMPLGTTAPDFDLRDSITDTMIKLSDIASDKATVVMFICNHCPYVLHINEEIVRLANEYIEKGVSFVAINSNDVENYPDDSPENMKKLAAEAGYPFPYLFDETQGVAKAYDAACTPDFYVFDGDLALRYRGQLDESRPKRNPTPVTGRDLRAALDAVLERRKIDGPQWPSGGCNIKWKA